MSLIFCKNCVMDGSVKELVLDDQGICNFCKQAQKSLKEIKEEKIWLPRVIHKIKESGHPGYDVDEAIRGKVKRKYDCLIGLSGGVDSSTVLHNAVKMGLRPLCFSIDNGYNDPKADENIMRMVETLKVPFYRYNIDLVKFKELQGAFLKAGLINVEIPTDHILMAATYEMAEKYEIKWVLSGGNVATESIMPASWSYPARDLKHIKAVYRWATGKELKGLPVCGLLKWNFYKWVKGIKILYLLDYVGYNRAESIKTLEKEYGWKNYYEKHCENLFTWWFQNFYLYEKFGIDKRKAHLSSLINSGQMTRKEAMDLLADRPVYPKFGLEDKVMQYEKRSHYDFPTDEKLFNFISKVIKKLR